ncbi:MAG: LuxR C-terminal-related transcriptional regulator, partial [Desulfosudis oleivorans]|nr:LuxR C-terminal-related transcriptional regulator [Desulfosudis oleivorans]
SYCVIRLKQIINGIDSTSSFCRGSESHPAPKLNRFGSQDRGLLIRPPRPDGTEREVLGLMTQGLNNNQIADQLVVSLSTAKFHVSSILSKLNAATRAEAVAIALKNNLVTSDQVENSPCV